MNNSAQIMSVAERFLSISFPLASITYVPILRAINSNFIKNELLMYFGLNFHALSIYLLDSFVND